MHITQIQKEHKKSWTHSSKCFKANEDLLHKSNSKDVLGTIWKVTPTAPYISICCHVFQAQNSRTTLMGPLDAKALLCTGF